MGESAEAFQKFQKVNQGPRALWPLGRREARPSGMCDPGGRGPIPGPAGPLSCSPRMIKVLSGIPGSPYAASKPTYDTLGQ